MGSGFDRFPGRTSESPAPGPIGWGSDPLRSGSGFDRFPGRGAADPAPMPAWRQPVTAEDISRWQQALAAPAQAVPLPALDWTATLPQKPSATVLSDYGPELPPLSSPSGSTLASVVDAAEALTQPLTPLAPPDPANAQRLESAIHQAPAPVDATAADAAVTGTAARRLRPGSPVRLRHPRAPYSAAPAAVAAQPWFDRILGMADLGIGGAAKTGLDKLSAAAGARGMTNLASGLAGAGKVAAVAAPALAYGAALLPVATGAIEGYQQAGGGGAMIQGGTAGAGALVGGLLGSVVAGPGIGTVIGAGIGSALGSAGGGMLTKGAIGAVDAAQGGDRGLVGMIGNALDPILDSTYEKEQKEFLRMENSPIMVRLRDEQRKREMDLRHQQTQQILLQAYAS